LLERTQPSSVLRSSAVKTTGVASRIAMPTL
jgi:hypothetical protein